jgi:DNA-binding beta-propeller fold protein YncE
MEGNMKHGIFTAVVSLFVCVQAARAAVEASPPPAAGEHRYLYAAVPGIRDSLEFGGHGVLVFDVDDHFKFVRRIAAAGLDAKSKPMNVKGICASSATGRLYVSTLRTLTCFDLTTDKITWERPYPGGCDRMSITPDGKTIYTPTLEGAYWNVIDGKDGDVVAKITPESGAHNTVVGLDGRFAYLAGLRSPLLDVVDTATNKTVRQVGPFSKPIRPFTVNGAQTLAFCCVNDLLGFEIGDLKTGKVLHRVEVEVEVEGFKKGPTKRHGCPSHGVGLTPDEKEAWVCDAHNQRLHVFDLAAMPPKQTASIELREEPGWITFSLDGAYAYSSTGEVIDVKTRVIVAALADEHGQPVHSEKMIEITFKDGKPVRNADQFGLGRVVGVAR